MKRILVAVAVVLLSGVAGAQMMMGGGMHGSGGGHGMGMGTGMGQGMGSCQMMDRDLEGRCMAVLDELGVAADVRQEIADRHFELQKDTIRKAADLHVLKLELGHMLDQKDFDLEAAQKRIGDLSAKQAEIRSAHVAFLHFVYSKLDPEQWRRFRQHHREMMSGMGKGMRGGKDDRPCDVSGQGMMHGKKSHRGMMMSDEGDSGEEH